MEGNNWSMKLMKLSFNNFERETGIEPAALSLGS